MTSNAGTSDISSRVLGFSGTPSTSLDHNKLIGALKNTFKPEFINRVDDIIIFDPLGQDALEEIATLMLNDVCERAKQLDIALSFDPKIASFIASFSKGGELGARPMRRAVTREVEDPLASGILEETIRAGDDILSKLDEASSKIVFIKQNSPNHLLISQKA